MNEKMRYKKKLFNFYSYKLVCSDVPNGENISLCNSADIFVHICRICCLHLVQLFDVSCDIPYLWWDGIKNYKKELLGHPLLNYEWLKLITVEFRIFFLISYEKENDCLSKNVKVFLHPKNWKWDLSRDLVRTTSLEHLWGNVYYDSHL